MIRLMKLTAVVLATSFVTPVQAESFVTANGLLRLCDSKSKSDLMGCIGFTQGVSDAHRQYARNIVKGAKSFCFPDGVSTRESRAVVIRYLKAHPRALELNAAAVTFVVDAFHEEWPCEK